jgi:hypothetical protein
MRFTFYLLASMAGLSMAAPANVKRQTDLDPLGLGATVEDVANQVTGLVGSILKREPILDAIPLVGSPLPDTERRDIQN